MAIFQPWSLHIWHLLQAPNLVSVVVKAYQSRTDYLTWHKDGSQFSSFLSFVSDWTWSVLNHCYTKNNILSMVLYWNTYLTSSFFLLSSSHRKMNIFVPWASARKWAKTDFLRTIDFTGWFIYKILIKSRFCTKVPEFLNFNYMIL